MKRTLFLNLIKLTVGAFIFALSVNMFALSNNLGEGGVTGITLLLYYTFQLPPALTNILFNAVLLVIGYKYLGKESFYYTLITVGLMSLFLHLTEGWQFHTEQTIVAAITAGFLMGIGIGIIMKAGGTTAGSVIIAQLLTKFFGWNTSYALLIIDASVVIPSIYILGLENMLLTIISLIVASFVLNFILEGSNPKKALTIISTKEQEIGKRIVTDVNRGVTVIPGYGFYKEEQKKILYVVINSQQLLAVYKIINEIDASAFVIVSEVQHVIGEGFTRQLYDK